ncbi:YitT family protein [Paenibacillus glycinis]|uniref:YitT family protein n=1 Tax=Paenibacillus glycinis TaxID=2697035 RepID=A0ABW9Y0A7_9BACL|nr:YitT family protein [Paenibacillus glycinis]NBD27914.1 YitT family protein [Paenibacillus glycinis]
MKAETKDVFRQWLQIIVGCMITAAGLILLGHAHVVTGGTAGLALSLSYLLPIGYQNLFMLLNVPFFVFSYMKMGPSFTLRTAIAISLLFLFTSADHWLGEFSLPALGGSFAGGSIVGFGVCVLIKNGASLGGSSILALYLQRRYSMDPGQMLFAFDCAVLLTGLSSLSLADCLISGVSIVMTSGIVSLYKGKLTFVRRFREKQKPATTAA